MTAGAIGKDILFDLKLIPLFAGLNDADLQNLLASARLRDGADGEVIFRQNDQADEFFVVLDGHVELYVETGENRRSTVEIMLKGAVIGEAAVFDAGPRPVSARILGAARLLEVPAAPFLAALDQRFDLVLRMLGSMSFRLRVLVRQIAELKLKSTAQRLGSFLLSLTEAAEGRAVLRFPYDKKIVADKLGMKPESLSRALGKLARIGVESCADNSVIVTDLARLRRFCTEDDMG